MGWWIVIGYVALGALFALWFFFTGHRRIDASASGASALTRLLWLPASLLLWPLLTLRLLRSTAVDAS